MKTTVTFPQLIKADYFVFSLNLFVLAAFQKCLKF